MKNKLILGLLILGILFVFGCTKIGQGSTYMPTQGGGTIDLAACVLKCNSTTEGGAVGLGRMGCKLNCYSNKAVETKQPETCDPLLTDPDAGINAYTVCLQTLGKDIRSAEPCKRVANEPVQYNICVSNIAQKINDPSMCELIVPANGYLGEKADCTKGSR
ncbi:MAG: hypothetical protein AABX38_02720 [Candidatus Micrarchaeota archaeon]